MTDEEKQAKALRLIAAEHEWAVKHFEPFHSMHEGYAVLLEEIRELEREVFKNTATRDVTKAMRETIQVEAMAMRFIVDCCPDLEVVREKR